MDELSSNPVTFVVVVFETLVANRPLLTLKENVKLPLKWYWTQHNRAWVREKRKDKFPPRYFRKPTCRKKIYQRVCVLFYHVF